MYFAYNFQNNLFEDFQRLVNIGPQDINQSGPSPSVENIIEAFNSILYEMTIQPGSVEDSLKPFVDLLQNCSDDQAINGIVESLFEQVLFYASVAVESVTLVRPYLCSKRVSVL